MASEKILNQKKKEVEELAEKIKKAKLVLLTDYKGINVEDVTKLRASLRTTDTEYKVIKNNITKRALEVCRRTRRTTFRNNSSYYRIRGLLRTIKSNLQIF